MKIYTKTGDAGETALLSGKRVKKHHLRLRAYGAVDELNAHLGLLRSEFTDGASDALLLRIQNELFALGSHLANEKPVEDLAFELPRLDETLPGQLEKAIDEMEADLPPLRSFILPAGSPNVARAHIARTVCRRAERETVALAETEPVPEAILVALNRLSDYFFVLARHIGRIAGAEEIKWRG